MNAYLPLLDPKAGAFDGETYGPERDYGRLTSQLALVRVILSGHAPMTLSQMRDKTFTPQPRKETRAHQDAGAAAAGETRPQAQPFLVADAAAEGLHGEPWALDNSGAVHDAAGITIADPVGCELVEPDDMRAMERIVACVNFCKGVATEDLRRDADIEAWLLDAIAASHVLPREHWHHDRKRDREGLWEIGKLAGVDCDAVAKKATAPVAKAKPAPAKKAPAKKPVKKAAKKKAVRK